MAKKSSSFYKLGRQFNKIGSVLNDIENLCSGHPEKIVKKKIRKKMYKETNKIIRKII